MGLAKIDSGTGDQWVPVLPGLDVTVGMFFDGTDNNKTNTEARVTHSFQYIKGEGSYENAYTNVVLLWKNFKEDANKLIFKHYVEGAGTGNLQQDDSAGLAIGSGNTGLPAKVKIGCQWIADKLQLLLKANRAKAVDHLTIDVFGFSRGAAEARHFIYEVTKAAYTAKSSTEQGSGQPAAGTTSYMDDINNDTEFPKFPMRGYLGAYCEKYNVQVNSLSIRFAGLFDTVASYSHDYFLPTITADTSKQFKNDTEELHLDAVALARACVQLCAANEYRGNFPLTTIESAGAKGQSYSLPGAHSDIGGGYVDNQPDEALPLDNGSREYIDSTRERLINEGWFIDGELTNELVDRDNKEWTISGRRKSISNKYSLIPLHFMCRLAIQRTGEITPNRPIPFDESLITSGLTSLASYPFLLKIKSRLARQVFENGPPLTYTPPESLTAQNSAILPKDNGSEGPDTDADDQKNLRLLKHKYLHWSANYTVSHRFFHPMYPRLDNNQPERLIIPG